MALGRHRRHKHGIEGRTHKAKPKDRRAPSGVPRKPPLSKDLRRVFTLVGTVVSAAGDTYCGGILIDRSGPLADALARLASEDARIAKWIARASSVGPYGALVVAAAEVAVPIAAHHGLIGSGWAELVGAPSPTAPAPEPEPSPTDEVKLEPDAHVMG
jgi:hypothetical protein